MHDLPNSRLRFRAHFMKLHNQVNEPTRKATELQSALGNDAWCRVRGPGSRAQGLASDSVRIQQPFTVHHRPPPAPKPRDCGFGSFFMSLVRLVARLGKPTKLELMYPRKLVLEKPLDAKSMNGRACRIVGIHSSTNLPVVASCSITPSNLIPSSQAQYPAGAPQDAILRPAKMPHTDILG